MHPFLRRLFTTLCVSLCFTLQLPLPLIAQDIQETPPNFIVIFADDLGYGDLGVYGHPTIHTPHLDQMAFEGQKWTNFYVAASVCTPSRAGLMTGRLPIRSGMASDQRRVLFPDSQGGLPSEEISIASLLKSKGYQTAAIGKWHLGHQSPFLPTDHGFDSYFGIPYSNDMNRVRSVEGSNWIESHFLLADQEDFEAFNVPLLRDTLVVEQPTDQRTLTKRYTEEAVQKIKEMKDSPFFIYLAHSLPHIPLFRSAQFKNQSMAGIYGDVIEEIDWSVGKILQTLKDEGIAENTLVLFTSDNGPWHIFKTHGGSAGLLRGAKGGTFEGGMRVPAIFWWPSKLNNEVIREMGTTLDLFPTFSRLSGATLPADRTFDGVDLTPVLLGKGKSPRNLVFFYRGTQVYAIRMGDYKAHFFTQNEYGSQTAHPITNPATPIQSDCQIHEPPLLFNLAEDPAERFNIAEAHPDIIEQIRQVLKTHQDGIQPVENQLEK